MGRRLSLSLIAVAFLLPAADAQAAPANGKTVTVCGGDAICTLSEDGHVRTFVTEGDYVYQASPSFSPDGETIVYIRDIEKNRESTYEIFSVGADGTDRRRLTNGPLKALRYDPQLSPDGRSVVYTRNPGGIVVLDLDSGEERVIAEGYGPSLSPDGTEVAYLESEEGGGQSLHVVGIDGSDSRLVSPAEAGLRAEYIDWFPDGQRIGFRVLGDYYEVRSDGTGYRRILDLEKGIGSPALSPDGEQLAYTRRGPRCYTVEPGRFCEQVLATVPLPDGTPGPAIANGYADDWGPLTDEAAPTGRCRGVEATITGTDLRDVLRGTDGPDVIDAGAGDDTIYGFDGDDLLCAKRGRDEIVPGEGEDTCRGGPGVDYLSECEIRF